MKNRKHLFLSLSLCSISTLGLANDHWYLKATTGFSQLSDQTAQTTGIGAVDGLTDVQLDSGFTPGLAFGKQLNDRWSAELAWEYRSNDSSTTLADGDVYPQGNYASNVFTFNGYYHFSTDNPWQPYLGAGVMLIQEIDLDLERDGIEQSYSGDGDVGLQVMAGVRYAFNADCSLLGEVRYGRFGHIDLSGENNTGQLTDLDYDPLTLGLGLQYNF